MSGYVFKSADGKLYMGRCPECLLENWAPAVVSGQCCWCGYIAKEGDIRDVGMGEASKDQKLPKGGGT